MTSSAQKERARRAAIEADWVLPDPLVPRHEPDENERPRNAASALAAIQGRGFKIEEAAATSFGLPKWQRIKPEDPLLSYVAKAVPVYELVAVRMDAKADELAALRLLYIDGSPKLSRLGYGEPHGPGRWVDVPITQLAKTALEALG